MPAATATPAKTARTPTFTLAKGTSLHRQLFLVLRDQISSGVFAAGAALPKEESLCERFGVSRITVRRALSDLAALGLVERRHGLGTFVKPGLRQAREIPSLGLLDSLRQTALDTGVRVLKVEHAEPPLDVAALLKLAPGVQAMHALRLRTNPDGSPCMLTESWVPLEFARGVSATALKKQALYEILMAQGVKFGRVVQEFTAVVSDPVNAALLETEVGGPLLKLVRLMHDLDGRPVQHLMACMRGESSRILMEIAGADINTLNAGQIVHDTDALPRR